MHTTITVIAVVVELLLDGKKDGLLCALYISKASFWESRFDVPYNMGKQSGLNKNQLW